MHGLHCGLHELGVVCKLADEALLGQPFIGAESVEGGLVGSRYREALDVGVGGDQLVERERHKDEKGGGERAALADARGDTVTTAETVTQLELVGG